MQPAVHTWNRCVCTDIRMDIDLELDRHLKKRQKYGEARQFCTDRHTNSYIKTYRHIYKKNGLEQH